MIILGWPALYWNLCDSFLFSLLLSLLWPRASSSLPHTITTDPVLALWSSLYIVAIGLGLGDTEITSSDALCIKISVVPQGLKNILLPSKEYLVSIFYWSVDHWFWSLNPIFLLLPAQELLVSLGFVINWDIGLLCIGLLSQKTPPPRDPISQ